MDVVWGYLSSLNIGNGSHKFGRISNVASTVLILPHSNAGEERVPSLIKKKQNSILTLSPGRWYTGLSADYQNGPQKKFLGSLFGLSLATTFFSPGHDMGPSNNSAVCAFFEDKNISLLL